MKISKICLLIVIILIIFVLNAQALTESEPNNECAYANIGANVGTVFSGSISNSGDNDWFDGINDFCFFYL